MARVGITLRVPDRLHAELAARCVESGRSLNDTIVNAIEFALDTVGRMPPDVVDHVLQERENSRAKGF